ncbi:MAG: 16S rRNA (cytosine(1402)-N(4))-methyltransferase RsmH [Eubacteriales bacterium]
MNESKYTHTSVLLNECVDALQVRDHLTYIDCTAGSGSHSFQIAKRMGANSRLICIDRDAAAIAAAGQRLFAFGQQVRMIRANFSELENILQQEHVDNLGGVLLDLGCSSHQFDTPDRGFSYNHDARLDMRMDTDQTLDAYLVVNTYPEAVLKKIIYEYGEERFAPQIAALIVKTRANAPITTTKELSELIKQAIPAAARADGPHPAKRTFQAIRIEVNGELDAIAPALQTAVRHLVPGGRVAVISFHSLEDRIVKETFAELAQGCTCPKDFPVCICGRQPLIRPVSRKPILPSAEELSKNPRARSAKLRVVEKR